LAIFGYSIFQKSMTSLSAFWTIASKQTASNGTALMSGQVPLANPCTGSCAFGAGARLLAGAVGDVGGFVGVVVVPPVGTVGGAVATPGGDPLITLEHPLRVAQTVIAATSAPASRLRRPCTATPS
jgi:hypothetical protein